jgi:hypothetical protein
MPYVAFQPIPPQFQDSSSVNLSGGTLEFYLSGTSTPTNIYSDDAGTVLGTSVTLNASGYPESGGNVVALYRDVDVDLKVVLKDASAVTLWTSDDLVHPDASAFNIAVGAGQFDGTDVTTIQEALEDAKGNYKVKNAEESRASTTALADDSNLAGWTVGINDEYLIEGVIFYTQNVGDLQFGFQASATPAADRITYRAVSASGDVVASVSDDITAAQAITTMTDTNECVLLIHGFLRGNASASLTLDFQWAQNTSSANNTTLHIGSYIRLRRLLT